MGFWDTVGKIAGSAMNEVREVGERNKVYKQEMSFKSDDELARIIKREGSSSPLKSGAAIQELKSRGYNEDDIKLLVRTA